MEGILVTTAEELQWRGAELASLLSGGEVIVLSGDLAAGKTTFTQGLAQGLGITEPVTSPTFTLIQVYTGRLTLVHCDFYRLRDSSEVLGIGLWDYLSQNNVVVVEWGEAFLEVLPEKYIHMFLQVMDQGRYLSVEANYPAGRELVEKWVSMWRS